MLVQIQYDEYVTKYKVYEEQEMIYELVAVNGINLWEIYDLHSELRDMEIGDAEISKN